MELEKTIQIFVICFIAGMLSLAIPADGAGYLFKTFIGCVALYILANLDFRRSVTPTSFMINMCVGFSGLFGPAILRGTL